MGRKDRIRLNSKGFSLVELIIVIAIMAVLAGTIAPALIKYLEKSRKTTDMSNATEIEKILVHGFVEGYIDIPEAKKQLDMVHGLCCVTRIKRMHRHHIIIEIFPVCGVERMLVLLLEMLNHRATGIIV